MTGADVVVRARRPTDLDALADILWAQQPRTRYPVRSTLPFPTARFLHADDADGAWTAAVDGRPVGHACWLQSPDAAAQLGVDPATGDARTAADACADAHGCAPDGLGWVSALFVDPAMRGRGVGRMLLAAVVDDIRGAGLHPCLEVVDLNEAAVRRYRADGWRTVLRARPGWLASAVDDDSIGTSTMVLLSTA